MRFQLLLTNYCRVKPHPTKNQHFKSHPNTKSLISKKINHNSNDVMRKRAYESSIRQVSHLLFCSASINLIVRVFFLVRSKLSGPSGSLKKCCSLKTHRSNFFGLGSACNLVF